MVNLKEKKTVGQSADPAAIYLATSSRLAKTRIMQKGSSPIYKTEEWSWSGRLKRGSVVRFVTKEGRLYPDPGCYDFNSGPGITIEGAEAIGCFKVEGALTFVSENGEQIYNYIDSESELVFTGTQRRRTFYLRIYDEADGERNGRWIVISATRD